MKRFLFILTLACTTTFFAKSQDYSLFNHLNVSLRISTMGIGVEAATPINDYFRARAGLDILSTSTNYFDISFDYGNNLYDAFGYVPNYCVKLNFGMYHGHLLADFHPIPTSIFHITAGVFLGYTKITADGYLADSNGNEATLLPGYEWPHLEWGGRKIDVTGGRTKFDLQLGLPVKPYVGFGLGRSITKSRLGFKFELGVLYQGNYVLKQDGHKQNFNGTDINELDDVGEYMKWLKVWPIVNVQLTYRIF